MKSVTVLVLASYFSMIYFFYDKHYEVIYYFVIKNVTEFFRTCYSHAFVSCPLMGGKVQVEKVLVHWLL